MEVLIHYSPTLVDYLLNFGKAQKPARLVTVNSKRFKKGGKY